MLPGLASSPDAGQRQPAPLPTKGIEHPKLTCNGNGRLLQIRDGANDIPITHVASEVVVLINRQDASMSRMMVVKTLEILRIVREQGAACFPGVGEMSIISAS